MEPFAGTGDRPLHVIALMPLRDDWTSAAALIRQLDKSISPGAAVLDILLVDDCSLQPCDRENFQYPGTAVRSIRVLRLRRALGHQRAIAIGLAHLQQVAECDAVMVMDADGEDTAQGAAALLRAYVEESGGKAVFAARARRSESVVFQAGYRFYKVMHRCLTGIGVRVGNFSILPARYLKTLVVLSELWNHYAAAVFRSGLPFTMIPIARGKRIAGESRMNFVALVSHGLSAMSVFGDIVGVRILIGSVAGSLLAALGVIAVITIRLLRTRGVPELAAYAAGTLAIIVFQVVTIAMSFTFFMLWSRANLGFIPARDYLLFVDEAFDLRSA